MRITQRFAEGVIRLVVAHGGPRLRRIRLAWRAPSSTRQLSRSVPALRPQKAMQKALWFVLVDSVRLPCFFLHGVSHQVAVLVTQGGLLKRQDCAQYLSVVWPGSDSRKELGFNHVVLTSFSVNEVAESAA